MLNTFLFQFLITKMEALQWAVQNNKLTTAVLNNTSPLTTPETPTKSGLRVPLAAEHRAGQRTGYTVCLLLSASETALVKQHEKHSTCPMADIHPLLFCEAHKVLCTLSSASFSMKAGPVGAGVPPYQAHKVQLPRKVWEGYTACEPFLHLQRLHRSVARTCEGSLLKAA